MILCLSIKTHKCLFGGWIISSHGSWSLLRCGLKFWEGFNMCNHQNRFNFWNILLHALGDTLTWTKRVDLFCRNTLKGLVRVAESSWSQNSKVRCSVAVLLVVSWLTSWSNSTSSGRRIRDSIICWYDVWLLINGRALLVFSTVILRLSSNDLKVTINWTKPFCWISLTFLIFSHQLTLLLLREITRNLLLVILLLYQLSIHHRRNSLFCK